MSKVKNFFAAIGSWFKRIGIAIWHFIKRVGIVVGKWFKNWFVKVDGKDIIPVRIGRWFKNWFVKDESGTRVWGRFLHSENGKSIVSSLVCILIGVLVGILTIVIIDASHAGRAIGQILTGGFNHPVKSKGIASVLTQFAPLLLCGLAVIFAYKCGMFNIGVAGQYVAGALFLYLGALGLKLPWYLCLLMAILGGAIWGALPGLLKAFFGVNEVISGIMLNWIVLYVTNSILAGPTFYNVQQAKCYDIASVSPRSLLPTLGLDKLFDYKYIGLGVFLAIIAAIVIWVVLNKTKFGYEIKATGANKHGAKYAGMNEKKNIILTMAISGALAGLAAATYYQTGILVYNPNEGTALPAMGFNGIAVGFLGALSPIGTIFSALFITHISVGGGYLDNRFYSSEIADFISSIIIYACAFSLFIKIIIEKLLKTKKNKNDTDIQGGTPVAEVIASVQPAVDVQADVAKEEK